MYSHINAYIPLHGDHGRSSGAAKRIRCAVSFLRTGAQTSHESEARLRRGLFLWRRIGERRDDAARYLPEVEACDAEVLDAENVGPLHGKESVKPILLKIDNFK